MRQVRGEGFSVRFKRSPQASRKAAPVQKPIPASIKSMFQNLAASASYPPMPVLTEPANKAQSSQANANVSVAQKRLWIAAMKGDLRAIRMAIVEGADIDLRDKEGRTAMNIASQYGHAEVMKTLIAAKELKLRARLGDLPDTAFFRKFGTKA